jgi:hypothetical protein
MSFCGMARENCTLDRRKEGGAVLIGDSIVVKIVMRLGGFLGVVTVATFGQDVSL